MTSEPEKQGRTVKPPLVKICGLTLVENALACVRAGADYIGLVFFEKSPRHISLSDARKITSALPSHIPGIGVFVDEPYERIMKIVEKTGIQGVQLHGSEPPELVEALSARGLVTIKAFFASRHPDLSCTREYRAADFCLAEYGKGPLPGGNAESWDWGLAAGISLPLMLAGGLHPGNVEDAVARAAPRAVDASSGVEAAPGIKDAEKVKAFIRAAKALRFQQNGSI